MTSILKHVYIHKLADMVNEYHNKYHSATKMKSVDIMSRTYIDFGIENKKKNPIFKVCDDSRT